MTITKFGHCCLLIEDNGKKIVTDPGNFSHDIDKLNNIDFILITHEHQDHYHVESLELILKQSPNAKIYTIESVGKLLDEQKIPYTLVKNGDEFNVDGVTFEAIGEKHAQMHPTIPPSNNTGFLINHKLFFPGDAFTLPNKPVEILALPIAGPWMKVSEAVDYILAVEPKEWFPIHDGIMVRSDFIVSFIERFTESKGIHLHRLLQ